MKLPPLWRLVGILAHNMTKVDLKQILSTTSFTLQENEGCDTPIKFLLVLKRKFGKEFVIELKRLLSVCEATDLLGIVEEYERENGNVIPDISVSATPEIIRAGGCKKSKGEEMQKFRKALMEISGFVGAQELGILIGITPLPESTKEDITEGHELFEKMVRHGRISENDTELLQELLELLQLSKPLGILDEYCESFSSVMSNSRSINDVGGHGSSASAPEHARSTSTPVQSLASNDKEIDQPGKGLCSYYVRKGICAIKRLIQSGSSVDENVESSSKSDVCTGTNDAVLPPSPPLNEARKLSSQLNQSHPRIFYRSSSDSRSFQDAIECLIVLNPRKRLQDENTFPHHDGIVPEPSSKRRKISE